MFNASRTALLVLLLVSTGAYAQTPLTISLSGAAEVPPVASLALGSGKIAVLPDHSLSGSIKTVAMLGTMAHLHEGAVGNNGPVILTLLQTAVDSFALPADARLSDAQYASYMAGKLYVNVHSAQYPNGEIRAQLLHLEANGKELLLAK